MWGIETLEEELCEGSRHFGAVRPTERFSLNLVEVLNERGNIIIIADSL